MLMRSFMISIGTFMLFVVMMAVGGPVPVVWSAMLLLAVIGAALFWRASTESPGFIKALPAMAVVLAIMLGALILGGVSSEAAIVAVVSLPLAVLTLSVFLIAAALIVMGQKGEQVAVASLLGTPVYFFCGYTLYLMWGPALGS